MQFKIVFKGDRMKKVNNIKDNLMLFVALYLFVSILAFAGNKIISNFFVDNNQILSNRKLTLLNGDEYSLSIIDDNAENVEYVWTSSDDSIASVDENGKVYTHSTGTVTIYVSSTEGESDECNITVVQTLNSGTNNYLIEFDNTNYSLNLNHKLEIPYTLSSNYTGEIKWISSNPSVATVNEKGIVTGLKIGHTTITASIDNNQIATTCIVEVLDANNENLTIAVSEVSLNKNSLTIEAGSTEQLLGKLKPTNATNKVLTWTSSDTSVATVSSTGVVTAKKAGTATITVKTSNGKTATCKVTVTTSTVAVTGVSLNKTSTTLAIGNSETLTIAITPTNATNQTVTWTSSDTSVATVSSTGVVTANKAGTATITVKTSNGKTASCKVTIYSAPITTSNMLAGFSLVASYDSSTLKYWVESGGNKSAYGSNNMKIAHIWVKDPYNQMKIALAPKGFNSVDYGGNILKAEVDNKGYSSKGLIATNSGFFSQSSKTSSNPWGYSVQIPYVLNNGNVMRDDTGTDLTTSLIYWTWGMNKDGQLVTYGTNKSSANNTNIKNNIQNAGLKFTSSFSGTLVARNGEASTPGTDSATRTAICQIDSNNFILMTATNASFNNLTNFLKNYENCQFAINLDGGGSSTMYYKTNTNTVQNIYNNNNRKLADMVYFVEA